MERMTHIFRAVPPNGVNVIRWDGTPDLWGVIIADAEAAADTI